jgi:anti-sigma regulatory factor (Ser/Thr protein kinase)
LSITTDVLEVELASNAKAPRRAREAVAHRFGERLSADAQMELALIVSELVANSVKYGPGKPIALRVAIDSDGRIRGEVVDQGSGEVAIREMSSGGGGLGLPIVQELSERWGVHECSTHVWFELPSERS